MTSISVVPLSLKRGFDKSGSEIILNIFFVCVSFTGTTNKALQLLFLDNTIWKLKTGIPTDEELQRLAHDIPEDWKRIGRAVGLKEKHLRIIEIQNFWILLIFMRHSELDVLEQIKHPGSIQN